MIYDIEISGDFNAVELTFTAMTETGKAFMATMFGAGAVSVNIPKSKGEDFIRFIKANGYSINS